MRPRDILSVAELSVIDAAAEALRKLALAAGVDRIEVCVRADGRVDSPRRSATWTSRR